MYNNGVNILKNQEIKQDVGKKRISLVPTQIIEDITEVREYGVQKYKEKESWKRVELERYIDALLRHTICFVNDNYGKDQESGIEHYKHMACNMAFICELIRDKEASHENA